MKENTIIILSIAFLVAMSAKVWWDTRGICFFSGHNQTDNEKMLRMAAEIPFFQWPSKMHNISYGRGQLREYWVLGIKFVSLFFKNKFSEHISVTLALIAHTASGILIFLTVSHVANYWTAFIVTSLYATSMWPYQVAMYMGHSHLAQAFFLSSIYAMFRGMSASSPAMTAFLFLIAGAFIAASFVSSSASRKYPPMFFVAFLLLHLKSFAMPWADNDWMGMWTDPDRINAALGLALFVATANLGILLLGKPFVEFLRRKFKKTWDDQKVVALSHVCQRFIFKQTMRLTAASVVLYFLLVDGMFIVKSLAIFAGICLVAAHILLPDFVTNFNRYLHYLDIGQWASHFKSYRGVELQTFGHEIPEGFRGGGVTWVFKYFWRMVPFTFAFSIFGSICFVVLEVTSASNRADLITNLVFVAGVLFLGFLPPIVSEVTKSLQVGKSYFPSLLGLAFLSGMGLEAADMVLSRRGISGLGVYIFASVIVGFQFLLSAYQYLTDILPSRMSPTLLHKFLQKMGVKEFASYDNAFNDALVKTMLYTYDKDYKVTFVDSVEQAKDKVFVVPNISAKSVMMETQQFSIRNGDFEQDKALNELIKSKEIEKIALQKLKTMGCSPYFVHESEITSYRDLILNQITEEDRWRGHAWVLPPNPKGSHGL